MEYRVSFCKSCRYKQCGRVAQLVEQCPFKAWVLGSSPSALTTYLLDLLALAFLLQLQTIVPFCVVPKIVLTQREAAIRALFQDSQIVPDFCPIGTALLQFPAARLTC